MFSDSFLFSFFLQALLFLSLLICKDSQLFLMSKELLTVLPLFIFYKSLFFKLCRTFFIQFFLIFRFGSLSLFFLFPQCLFFMLFLPTLKPALFNRSFLFFGASDNSVPPKPALRTVMLPSSLRFWIEAPFTTEKRPLYWWR